MDDEPYITDLFGAALRFEGFSVDVAATGAEALEMARPSHHDLVLLDVMLPDLNGNEVCRKLRAVGVETPDRVPHRQGGDRGQGERAQRRWRRLRDQAVQPRRAGGADQGDPAEDRPQRDGDFETDFLRGPRHRRGGSRGLAPRPARGSDRNGVQPPQVPAVEREAGRLQVGDPGQRLGLRLRRRPEHRRDLHLVPTQEDRPVLPSSDPDRAWCRLQPEARPRERF